MSDILLTLLLSLLEETLWSKFSAPTQPTSRLLTLLSLFTLQYLLLKAHRHLLHPYLLSPLRHLPGPTNNVPLLGQFPRILAAPSPNEPFLTWSEKWPRAPFIRYLGLGNQETLLINTVDAHKEVLQTHCYAFKKPDLLFRLMGDILGRGLVFSEGAEHRRQRRILMGLFSTKNLRGIAPVFWEKGDLMAGWFEENLGGDGRGVFDLLSCYARMELDVVGRTVLGVELDNLKSADRKWDFAGCYHRIFQPSTLTGLITFINGVVPIRALLPIEANLGYIRDVRQARAMVTECVRQRIQELDQTGGRTESQSTGGASDLLTLILEERKMFKGSEDELTEQEIVDQLLTFVVAGHETTVGTLVWSSYILARNPDIQNKLRGEILDAIALNQNGRSLAYEDIDRLQYLNNFVRETLRLHSPAVISYREAIEDITICNTFIPKGTVLHFNVHLAGRSKATWGDDAEQFTPERWDNRQGDAASPYAFGAFSNGPRVCIGRGFALMNVKMYLVEMVRKFRFFESEDMKAWGDAGPPLLNPSFSLMAKGGLKVGIERI
ncbi:cytochrome P450 [Podospora conica]|nr:cytochrome P450 [Schizothecium conicum]